MASPDLHSLIEAARIAPVRADTPARVVPLIDLTSLKGGESPAEIEALCARAAEHGTAAVCIYAEAVPIARPLLAGSSVRVATVANFPHGGDDIAGTADETAAAVAAGADEVDIVAPISALLDGDVGLVGELVEACRAAAGPDIGTSAPIFIGWAWGHADPANDSAAANPTVSHLLKRVMFSPPRD